MTPAAPTHLTVETLEAPLGVPTSRPRFGWRLQVTTTQVRQRAYELQVLDADTEALIASSGRIASDSNAFVTLDGAEFASRTAYLWRVRVWGDGEDPSNWAQSSFETTLLDLDEWCAPWVEPQQRPVTREAAVDLAGAASGAKPAHAVPVEQRLHPAPMIRQVFSLAETPKRARLYITSHGLYDVLLNGMPISDEILAPGHDEHPHRLSYQTYDVTALLRPGLNVIGVTLADGFWAGRTSFTGESANYGELLGVTWQLEADREVVAISDATGRSNFGPTRYADIFIGEKYDAREERHGWASDGFDDCAWAPVNVAGRRVEGMVPFIGEPVRRLMQLKPTAILRTPRGETVVDLGQNIAGRIRLRANGSRGTEIKLEHTEALDREGNYQTNILGQNKDQTDIWILAGSGEEEFEPKFTYHGFRYVRVSNYPGELTPEKVSAFALGSDLALTGTFETDNASINRLHANVVWSQRANFLSTPTDCPQRERAGWTGDAQIFAPASTNNMHTHQFWTRWLANVRAAQRADGAIPYIVPNTPSFSKAMGFFGASAAGWGDAITIVPFVLFDRYGDLKALVDNYPAMKAWHDYVRGLAENNKPERYNDQGPNNSERQRYLWNTGFQFGDWLAPSLASDPNDPFNSGRATGELVGSACYFRSTRNLARAASLLGHTSTAREFEALAENIRAAFQDEFLEPDGRLNVHYQGAYVLALAFDLIPHEIRGRASQHLSDLIVDAGHHLDTGFISLPFLLDVLVDIGRSDLAYKILLQDTSPSWLYQVKMGATTIWEQWRGITEDGQPQTLSLNHYTFGAVDDWFFRHVAGIKAQAPGYKKILISPDLDAPFARVKALLATPNGPVSVSVEHRNGARHVAVITPANVEAHLRLGGETQPLHTGASAFAL